MLAMWQVLMPLDGWALDDLRQVSVHTWFRSSFSNGPRREGSDLPKGKTCRARRTGRGSYLVLDKVRVMSTLAKQEKRGLR